MANIDYDTNGLSERIINETFEGLREDNMVTRALKGFGNSTMAALGSGAARGRMKQGRAASHLMDLWNEYSAIGKKPWTYATIEAFLAKNFGGGAAHEIAQQLFNKQGGQSAPYTASTAPTPAASPAPAASAAPAPGAAAAKAPTPPGAAASTASTPASPSTPAGATPAVAAAAPTNAEAAAKTMMQAGGDDLKNLMAALEVPTPSPSQVMAAVFHLAQAANKDPAMAKKVIPFLQHIQQQYGEKVPQLKEVDFTAFLESHKKQLMGMVRHLVENQVSSRSGIMRAYNKFFITEAPTFKLPPKPGAQPTAPAKKAPFKWNGAPTPAPGSAASKAANPAPGSAASVAPQAAGAANAANPAKVQASQNAAPGPAPAAASGAPARILKKNEMMDIFNSVAGIMLDNGSMHVTDPKWTKMVRNFLGKADAPNSQHNGQNHGGNAGYRQPPARFDPATAHVDVNRLETMLQSTSTPANVQKSILTYAQNATVAKLLDRLAKAKIMASADVYSAIMKSHL